MRENWIGVPVQNWLGEVRAIEPADVKTGPCRNRYGDRCATCFHASKAAQVAQMWADHGTQRDLATYRAAHNALLIYLDCLEHDS